MPDSPVRLQLAAHQRYVRAARAVASSLASARGFDEAELDDLRIAVGELCVVLLALGDSSSITLELADGEGDDSIVVRGSAPRHDDAAGPSWDDAEHDLARQILGVVASEYRVTHTQDTVEFTLVQRRRHH